MGYESRIYLAKKHKERFPCNEFGLHFAEKIAGINLGKIGGLPEVFTRNASCYIFSDDGSSKITLDDYGEPLKEASVESVIQWLENDKSDSDYWRFKILLALLKECNATWKSSGWQNISELVVLHFGY